MYIGEILRYPNVRDPVKPTVDGLPNLFYRTHLAGVPTVSLERGINPIAPIKIDGHAIRPAVLVRSSPHRAGSSTTPWQDFYDPGNGHIRYFGDHRADRDGPPEGAPGNKVLLEQRDLHAATELGLRLQAAPLLFFLAVPHEGRIKGNVKFQGVGVIERVAVVSQWDRHMQRSFSNFRFDVVVVSLAPENEFFDWSWINARRSGMSLSNSLKLAPKAWREWVKSGTEALPRLRRSVAFQTTIGPEEQRPVPGSVEEKVLQEAYAFYVGKKSAFEGLAEIVAERVLKSSGADYAAGWITPRSGDHGADFVGRVDIGTGFAKTRLVVLGQAKCEKPVSPTGGRHIARTAARLRRGWLGVYVTTSFFSRPVQAEVLEDEYPLVLINGLQVAEVLLEIMFERGLKSATPILEELEAAYPGRISFRRPAEILLD